MHTRFTSLQFIIGLFFLLIALILLVGYFVTASLSTAVNLYAGFFFLLFGLLMMILTTKTEEKE